LLGGGSWRPIAARRCSFSRGRARRRAWAGPLRSELPALSMITTLRPHGSFARARRLPGAACTVPCGSAHVVRKGLQVGIPSCGLADGLGSASGGQGALTATEETRWRPPRPAVEMGARCDRVTFACAGLSLSAVTMTTELQLRHPTPDASDWNSVATTEKPPMHISYHRDVGGVRSLCRKENDDETGP
jgi:hypothetical protein